MVLEHECTQLFEMPQHKTFYLRFYYGELIWQDWAIFCSFSWQLFLLRCVYNLIWRWISFSYKNNLNLRNIYCPLLSDLNFSYSLLSNCLFWMRSSDLNFLPVWFQRIHKKFWSSQILRTSILSHEQRSIWKNRPWRLQNVWILSEMEFPLVYWSLCKTIQGAC